MRKKHLFQFHDVVLLARLRIQLRENFNLDLGLLEELHLVLDHLDRHTFITLMVVCLHHNPKTAFA